MRRSVILLLVLVAVLQGLIPIGLSQASNQRAGVCVVPVTGTVSPGLATFIRKSIEDADKQYAAAVLLEIDTFGGLVQAAVEIRDMILSAPLPVHAFVRGRAWSAGALITLACEKVVMSPGSSIGSAEPRPADAKSISAVRAEFEATAEARGKDALIAAAMVDQAVVIEGVKEKDQLLNLSASRALELGLADSVAVTREDALENLGLADEVVVTKKQSFADDLSRVLTDPTVSSALLTVGIIGLVIEIIRPGFGAPGIIGLLSLAVLLVGRSISKVAGAESTLLFLGGLILLSVEAFVPGFGFFGVSGIVAVVVGIVLAARASMSFKSALFSLLLAALAVAAVLRYASKRGLWSKISLSKTLEQARPDAVTAPGVFESGVAVSSLRPAGTANFGGKRFSVVTTGEFVESGATLEVVSVQGNRIVVRAAVKPNKD